MLYLPNRGFMEASNEVSSWVHQIACSVLYRACNVLEHKGQKSNLGSGLACICGNLDVILCLLICSNPSLHSV